MSDVFWTALFGALGPTVVAVAAAVANVFAPAHLAERARRAAADREREAARYRAAEDFLAALATIVPRAGRVYEVEHRSMALAARQRLVASLGSIDATNLPAFTTWLLLAVEREDDPAIQTLYINQGGDRIFASLMGAGPTFLPLPFTPDRQVLSPPQPGKEPGDLF